MQTRPVTPGDVFFDCLLLYIKQDGDKLQLLPDQHDLENNVPFTPHTLLHHAQSIHHRGLLQPVLPEFTSGSL
jgi:hypothetical protein